jgi:hypothetical protein
MAVWTPRDIVAAEALLLSPYTEGIWQESNVGVPLTSTTDDLQNVGLVVDLSRMCHRAAALSDSARPQYSADGSSGLHACLKYSTTKYLVLQNTANCFNYLFTGTPKGGIAFKIKVTTDGTDMVILDNSGWTGIHKGITVARRNTNKLVVSLANGSTLQTYTSAFTLNAAAGLVAVRINFTGTAGAGGLTMDFNGTTESFSLATTTLTAADNAFSDMYVGALTGGTTPLNAYLSDVVISSDVIGASDWANYQAWNLYPTAETLSRSFAGGDIVDPWNMSHLFLDWQLDSPLDIQDGVTQRMWQNIGRTVPVASNADILGAVDFLPIKLGRNLAAAADDTTRPNWYSNQYNGKGTVRWIGTATPQNLAYPIWKPYGAETTFVVCRNTNVTTGSHFLASASSRFLATGDGYINNPVPNGGPGFAFFALHPTAGNAPFMNLGNLGQSINIMAYRRRGPKIEIYVNGLRGAIVGNVNSLSFSNMGTPQIAGWDLTGDVLRVVRFVTDLSNEDFDRVDHGLANRYGVPGVIYTSVVNKLRPSVGWSGGFAA